MKVLNMVAPAGPQWWHKIINELRKCAEKTALEFQNACMQQSTKLEVGMQNTS